MHPGHELIAVVSSKLRPRTSRELRVDERQFGADHLERFDAGRRQRAAVENTQGWRVRFRRGHDRHRSPSLSQSEPRADADDGALSSGRVGRELPLPSRTRPPVQRLRAPPGRAYESPPGRDLNPFSAALKEKGSATCELRRRMRDSVGLPSRVLSPQDSKRADRPPLRSSPSASPSPLPARFDKYLAQGTLLHPPRGMNRERVHDALHAYRLLLSLRLQAAFGDSSA
jgi:hypothetical protein